MKYTYCLALVCLLFFAVHASRRSQADSVALINELSRIKTVYETERSRLRRTTDNRWNRRQQQVEQKTLLQQAEEKARAEIEQLYGEIARIREEVLIRENGLSAARAEYEHEKDRFNSVGAVFESILRKEEEAARQGFPIGQQLRSLQIQEMSHEVKKAPGSNNKSLAMVQRYFLDCWAKQRSCDIKRETILLADNSTRETSVIRLGAVTAFGIDDTGAAFYLGYTGQGVSPFEWVTLTDRLASQTLVSSMPDWLETETIKGDVYIDVLQNSYSEGLLGIERKTVLSNVTEYVKAGGVVMIPLALICLWAIILFINRLVVYAMAHSQDDRFIDDAVEFLNQKKHSEADAFAGRSKGVLARILSTCLKHSKWKRPAAEKAVKELLLAEVPALDKHLDTMAVIAGAAPLLGLLGTVTGMISMFESITRFGTGDPKLLAGGISEALITTEVGLAIAIPVLLAHNFLRNRRNHIQADMEMYAMRILNRLWPEE